MLDSLPSPESGFEVEFVEMTLPGRYECRLRIGWAPSKEGVLSEKILLRFGRHYATLRLVASCINAQSKVGCTYCRVRGSQFLTGCSGAHLIVL